MVLKDAGGTQVAVATLEAEKGFLGLATGGLDIGTVTLRDVKADLVRDERGVLNVQRLVKQPKAQAKGGGGGDRGGAKKPGEPIRLPKGLKAKIVVKNVEATLTDKSVPNAAPTIITLSNLAAQAELDPAKPLSITCNASAKSSTDPAVTGTIKADILASDWARSDGTVLWDSAKLDADVQIGSFPMQLVDAFVASSRPVHATGAHAPPLLAEALGKTLFASVRAKGTMKNATAAISASTTNATASGEIAIAQNVLTDVKPVTLTLRGSSLGELVPALRGALDPKAPTRLTLAPDTTVTLDRLKIKLPTDGAKPDLRGSSLRAAFTLTETKGTVAFAGQPAREMRIEPLTATLDAPDLAGPVTLAAKTKATLGDDPAGDLTINATLAGLLDEKGTPVQGMPREVRGSLSVKGMATAIGQPFVQALGLDLPRDIGPRLDVNATAASAGPADKPGNAPPIDVDWTIASDGLVGSGSVRYAATGITARNKGVALEVKRAGAIAGAFTKAIEGVKIAGSAGGPGRVMVTVPTLDVPMSKAGTPRVDAAQASFTIEAQGLAVTPRGATTLDMQALQLAGSVRPGGHIAVKGDGRLFAEQREMKLEVDYKVPALFAGTDKKASEASGEFKLAPPLSLRPVGVVQLSGIPSSLLRSFVPPATPAQPGEQPVDLARLAQDVLGSTLRAKFTSRPLDNKREGLWVEGVLDSDNLKTILKADLTQTQVAVTSLTCNGRIAPSALEGVLSAFAPDLDPRPKLLRPSAIAVNVKPITIPLDKDMKPVLAQAGEAEVTITLPEKTQIDRLALGQNELRQIGAEGVEISLQVPVASLVPAVPAAQGAKPAAAKPASVNLKAAFIGPAGKLGDVRASAQQGLSAGKPTGTLSARLALEQLDVRGVDNALGKQDFLAPMLGENAGVTLSVDLAPGTAKDNAGLAGATGTVLLDVKAPNVKSSGPAVVRLAPESLRLEKPAEYALTLPPALVNALLAPKDTAHKPVLTATQPVSATLAIAKLVLPGTSKTSAKTPPDVALTLTVPAASFVTAENKKLDLTATRLAVRSETSAGTPLVYDLTVDALHFEGAPSTQQVALAGALKNWTDAAGAFTMSAATLDAKGNIPALPTALLDALAKKDGVLVDALGPTIKLDVDVVGYPLPGSAASGGRVALVAQSDRASATMKGNVGTGVLTVSEPLNVSLVEISQALSGRLVKGLPLVGLLEKTRENAPAVVVADRMTIPLSSDLSKLSGTVRIDPGEARFETSSDFAALLDLAKVKPDLNRTLGRRLEPMSVNIDKGVATYERWKLPLGEFTIETQGTVDLVSKRVDVVTWVPVGALTDSAAGLFKTDLRKLLGDNPAAQAATMLPFRTRGPYGDPNSKPRTEPDLDLFAKNVVKSLQPEKLIEKGLSDLLGKPKDKK